MREFLPNTYADRAFLGEKVGNQETLQRINAVAGVLNKAFNPTNDVARSGVERQSRFIVGGLAAAGEWPCDTAQRLLEATRDPHRTVNKSVAERRLGILTSAAYIAIKYGDNNGLRTALEKGSVQEIEDQLPGALKGIGEGVRNTEITNPGIRAILDNLDKRGRVLKAAGEPGKKQLVVNLENAIVKLSELNGLDARSDEEMMRVSAYLGAEVDALVVPVPSAGDGLTKNDLRQMFEGDGVNIPESFSEQLEYARQLLKSTEQMTGNYNNLPYQQQVARLEKYIDKFKPEIQAEIKARLCIDACYRLMEQARGFIDSKQGLTMGEAANVALELQHDPTREKMRFLFDPEGKSNGLPFRKVWDWMERANFAYLELLDEMALPENLKRLQERFGPRIVTAVTLVRDLETYFDNDALANMAKANFNRDSNGERKGWVRWYVADSVVRGRSYDGTLKKEELPTMDETEQAVRMAERAQVAFGESNVANSKVQGGNDQLAELIGLAEFRKGKKMRSAAGPQYHLNLIPTIPGATSWIRQEDVNPVPTDEPLYSDRIRWERVASGDYNFYYAVTLGKIYSFTHNYLLKMDVKPVDVLSGNIWRDVADLANRAERQSDVVESVENQTNLAVERKDFNGKSGRYVTYKGVEYSVVESTKTTDIEMTEVEGAYVYFYEVGSGGKREYVGKPLRIEFKMDNLTGEKEEYVKYGGVEHTIIDTGKPYVVLPGIGRREIRQGKEGSLHLRTRLLQGIVQQWCVDESLGGTMDAVFELGRQVCEQEMRPDWGTFITKDNWYRCVLNERLLDIPGSMAKLAAQRRVLSRKKNPPPAKY